MLRNDKKNFLVNFPGKKELTNNVNNKRSIEKRDSILPPLSSIISYPSSTPLPLLTLSALQSTTTSEALSASWSSSSSVTPTNSKLYTEQKQQRIVL